jgi:hypothetical protein
VVDKLELEVPRFPQPDDVSCGPTCLFQVDRFYGHERSFHDIETLVRRNPDGGTLGVYLALAALDLGYAVTVFPYNLRIFDPTWFDLPAPELGQRLKERAAVVKKEKLRLATLAYADFLGRGGKVSFAEPDVDLLVGLLDRGHPVVTGLSATWLYRSTRERPHDNVAHAIEGDPVGHFVVLCGYEDSGRRFLVSDPSPHAPFSPDGRYHVEARRLLNSLLLGDATFDAVLLELVPPDGDSR